MRRHTVHSLHTVHCSLLTAHCSLLTARDIHNDRLRSIVNRFVLGSTPTPPGCLALDSPQRNHGKAELLQPGISGQGDRSAGFAARDDDPGRSRVLDIDAGPAVRNKAQVWVFEALQQIRERLPFELLGLDSDNGAEFINYQLHRYCEQEQITFTRSRPLRKNDNCFVEQKNYSVVRRFAGYARYDTETELEVLKQLYGLLSPYVNFFLPSQKLQEKIRQGSRVTKRYDRAQTPDRRLLDSTQLSKQAKAELRRRFRRLNPAQLHREIVRLQEQLVALQTRKRRGVEGAGSDGKAQGGFPTAPWETPRKEFPTPPPAARTSF